MKRKHIIVLIVIYLAFVALGLPDALLGSSWNMVREELTMPLGAIGFVTFFSYILTMFATFFAPQVLAKAQTKHVTFFSILMTGSALILMSRATAFYQIVLLAIPLGMGAGAIDLSLNHYTAVHFKASHMNYLHSFYGLGVTFGPMIMAYTLSENAWRLGYVYVGLLLWVIAFTVMLSFKNWDEETVEHREEHHSKRTIKSVLAQKGVKHSLLIFLCYVHIESFLGVFVASYAYLHLKVGYSEAALFTMTYFLALTIGRLFSGFLSHNVHPNKLILFGELLMVVGGILLLLPGLPIVFYYLAVGFIGVGSGPVFPNMMHMNPHNFNKQAMSRIMSLQMIVGYLGFGLLTPIMGQVLQYTSITIYPYVIVGLSVVLLLITIQFFGYQLHKTNEKAA